MRASVSLAILAFVGAGRINGDMGRLFGQAFVGAPHAAQAATLGEARLQGRFELRGRVTVAHAMIGEHVGEIVTRSWTFVPQCAAGPCGQVLLLRQRAQGSDKTMLSERAPGHYAGAGAFFAPLHCGTRAYAHGELVPFTITARVTDEAASAGAVVATALSASYTNRTRTNLTRCVDVHRDDAAVYTGALVATSANFGESAPYLWVDQPIKAIVSEPRTRSSRASWARLEARAPAITM